MSLFSSSVIVTLLVCVTFSQNPGSKWLGYALGTNPNGDNSSISSIEMYWIVPEESTSLKCDFSVWFGIETNENTTSHTYMHLQNQFLIEDNPMFLWCIGSLSLNGQQDGVFPGDLIHASITLDEVNQRYRLDIADLTIKNTHLTRYAQIGLNDVFSNVYIAFEYIKGQCLQTCNVYPPDDIIRFHNISVSWNGQKLNPKWNTGFGLDICGNRANVIDESTVAITWNATES
eukprot:261157_1